MNEKIMPSFGQSFGVLKYRWLDVTLRPTFLMPLMGEEVDVLA